MRPHHQTWRVQGVPGVFDHNKLADVLQDHLNLIRTNGENGSADNSVRICTLEPDPRGFNQVATIRFQYPPQKLTELHRESQLTIDVPIASENAGPSVRGGQRPPERARLAIDQHFNGITVLHSPPDEEHQIDILALSGLGSHPYGSFAHKDDGHMWLSDSLPQDVPMARAMIYGYSSRLLDSTSVSSLEDLAISLQLTICRLLKSKRKPLVLIGHSLGGLVIKEALIRIVESDEDSRLIDLILGLLFFGVPNEGMDICSLVPMVTNQPNEALLESLRNTSSQILTFQRRNFSKVLKQNNLEIFCFYETRLSPTAAKDSTGQYKMNGPVQYLVSRASATTCLPHDVWSDHSIPMDRTHSDLVKFTWHDSEYENVSFVMVQMLQRYTNSGHPKTSLSGLSVDSPRFSGHKQPETIADSIATPTVSVSRQDPVIPSACEVNREETGHLSTQYLRPRENSSRFQLAQELQGHQSYVDSVAFSPNSQWLASGGGDKTIRIWKADGQGQFQLAQELEGHQGYVDSVAFSPNGQWLASGCLEKTIRIWKADGQGQFQLAQELEGRWAYVDSVAFSPNGQWLASGCRDKTIRIWKADGQGQFQLAQELEGHQGYVDSVAFSPNGQWLDSCGRDKTILIWKADGQGQFQLEGRWDYVYSVAFSPNGQWLASGSTGDKTIRIWKADGQGQFQLAQELEGHQGYVDSLAFSPNGQWLASGSTGDKTIRIWGSFL